MDRATVVLRVIATSWLNRSAGVSSIRVAQRGRGEITSTSGSWSARVRAKCLEGFRRSNYVRPVDLGPRPLTLSLQSIRERPAHSTTPTLRAQTHKGEQQALPSHRR